jgi:putative MFS transporter
MQDLVLRVRKLTAALNARQLTTLGIAFVAAVVLVVGASWYLNAPDYRVLGTLICALSIDYVGRRIWFAIAFAAAAVSLGMLASIASPQATQVLTYMSIAYFFVSTINIGVYLYTPELYPTRARALGVGTATAWLRLASMIGPIAVGYMIAGGLQSVFVAFAIVAAIAAVITAAFAVETKGRVLEEVSP